MSVISINKGGSRQITKNFNEKELQSKSVDAPDVYLLSKNTLDALQWIRDYYGPIIPTSVGRTPLHNRSIGSGDSSLHLITSTRPVGAIDFRFVNKANQDSFQNDMAAKGAEWRHLRSIYKLTIGLYDSFSHIDDGQGAGVSSKSIFTDEFGKHGFWDLRSKKKNLIDQITSTITNNTDGFNDWPKAKAGLITLVFLLIGYLGFKIVKKA